MAAIRDLVVHVNDEAVSRHAFELATCLAADLGARLTAVLVAAPVNAGVGLSAETASLAQQLAQAQRATLLGIGDRLAAGARQRHDLAVELRCADGEPVEVLQSYARTADLLITSQRDPARDGGLSTGQSARLLVGSACPVLTVPYVGLTAEGAVSGEAAPLRRRRGPARRCARLSSWSASPRTLGATGHRTVLRSSGWRPTLHGMACRLFPPC